MKHTRTQKKVIFPLVSQKTKNKQKKTVYPPPHVFPLMLPLIKTLTSTYLVCAQIVSASDLSEQGLLWWTSVCGWCCSVWESQVKRTSVMLLYNQHSCVGDGYEKTSEEKDTGIQRFHHIHRAVTEFYDCYHTNGAMQGGGTHFMSDRRAPVLRKAAVNIVHSLLLSSQQQAPLLVHVSQSDRRIPLGLHWHIVYMTCWLFLVWWNMKFFSSGTDRGR